MNTIDWKTNSWQEMLIEEAQSWKGTPFHHGAAVKGVGVDCVHLLTEILVAANLIDRMELPFYHPDWHLHQTEERYLQGLAAYCDEVVAPWQVGDILSYRFGRAVSHASIYIGDNQMVHAYNRQGVIQSDWRQAMWRKRFAGGYRLKCLRLS